MHRLLSFGFFVAPSEGDKSFDCCLLDPALRLLSLWQDVTAWPELVCASGVF